MVEFWRSKPSWHHLPKEKRKSMIAKWNSLLLSLPNAGEAEPILKWCCFSQFTAPFDLLIISACEEYDLIELGADIPQLDWPLYFEKVAFTISTLTAKEYVQKLHLEQDTQGENN